MAAVEEERFSGIKHDGAFPLRAARWCCQEAAPDGVDAVAFYHQVGPGTGRRLAHFVRHLPASLAFLKDSGGQVGGWAQMASWGAGKTARRLGWERSIPMRRIEHHRAHAADAVVGATSERCAVLVIDGMGEWLTTSLSLAEGASLRRLEQVAFPHSLGLFWETITHFLGFRAHGDEYKIMGLAAHGAPEFLDEFRRMIPLTDAGLFRLDLSWFSHHTGRGALGSPRFTRAFGAPRTPGAALTDRDRAVAASAQARLEEVVLALARTLHRATGCRQLALGGGVALNSAVNGRLLAEGPFDSIVVPPAPHDAGAAVGAARALWCDRSGAPWHGSGEAYPLYGGPCPGSTSEPGGLGERGLEEAARRLASGEVIGWCEGPLEFGPRALGHRSILADPRSMASRGRVNDRIKGREEFRPLAPAVLGRAASHIFYLPHESPRMSFAVPVRHRWRERIPAVVHADGSARVQTVHPETSPRFHALIERFERWTGVPVLLNTSLNVAGQTMARSTADALRAYREGRLDALFVDGRLIETRRPANAEAVLGQ